MFVISTRNFPPDVGGMQNLLGGLAKALAWIGLVYGAWTCYMEEK